VARTWMKVAIPAVAMFAMSLAGCFEITKDAAFRENGEARVEIEMALAAELAALLKNPAFAKQMAKEGALDLFADCGKPWPTEKPLPAGVRSVESRRGARADMESCTFVAEVSDPVAAVVSVNEMQPPPQHKVPKQEMSLVRLDGRTGYRLRIVLPPLKLPTTAGDARDVGKAVLDAMFVNRHFTISLSGQRIENTNGELASDGRRVTWRIPIATAIDPGRETPLTIEADIIYR
jgi:hypothetical protein